MKKTIAIIVLLGFFLNGYSQNFKLGVKFGTSINKISGQSFKDGFTFGYHVGAFSEIKLSNKFFLQPEVYFSEINVDSSSDFKQIYANLTAEKMPYSVGGHPGFALKDKLSNYELQFSHAFQAERCLIEGNYYSGETKTMSIAPVLPLDFSLFASDALVFKQPSFQSVTLAHATKGKLVTLHFESIDAIGFWTKEHAPFFCIEPWWGWADSLNHSGNLAEKDGMHWLDAGSEEKLVYWVEVF
jgi:hypothetical protein